MKGMKIIGAFFVSGFLSNIEAFPYQAGHCDSGSLADRSAQHGSFGRGDPIAQGGFTITIGGMSPSLGNTLDLNVGQEYNVKIERTNGSFRGLLFRLPGPNVFSIPAASGADGFQLHPSCDADVSAVTHSNNDDKSLLEFTLKYESAGEKILDVTTVITKSAGNWYHSSYLLNFLEVPTSTPTKAPTLMPTAPPTQSPTTEPTLSPTPIPTLSPTSSSPTTVPTTTRTPDPTSILSPTTPPFLPTPVPAPKQIKKKKTKASKGTKTPKKDPKIPK